MTAALICDDCGATVRAARLPEGWANHWPKGDDAMRHRCPDCSGAGTSRAERRAAPRARVAPSATTDEKQGGLGW